MNNPSTCRGSVILVLAALAVLAGYQRGLAEDEIIKAFRKAAEQGDSLAQYTLGVAYTKGVGVPEDDREAVKWFQLAAAQRLAKAQSRLGFAYFVGKGVPQDTMEAVKWWRLAAEQGEASAQFSLGGMYAQGKGVLEDYVKAYAWMNLAAAQGTKEAVKGKDGLRPKMTAEQIAEAQKLSRELLKRIKPSKSK